MTATRELKICSVSKRSFSISDFLSGPDMEMKYHVSGVSDTHILPKELGTAVLLPSGTLAQSCAPLYPHARVLTHCDRIRLGGLAPFYRRKPEVQEYLVYSHPHPLCSEMIAGSSSPVG